MSDKPKYSTIQQHQPLYAPKGWNEEEKRFVRTLQGILEDIYKRYGRLGLSDLSKVFRGTVEGLEGSVNDLESGLDSTQTNVTTLNQALSLLNTTKLAKSEVLNTIFPVGSLYLSVSSTSPASLFGGTWERLGGRFLLGADDAYPAGSTGGEAAVTLEKDQLPTVEGSLDFRALSSDANIVSGDGEVFTYTANGGPTWSNSISSVGTAMPCDRITMRFGGSQPHNNLPPYLAVYIWKRTA